MYEWPDKPIVTLFNNEGNAEFHWRKSRQKAKFVWSSSSVLRLCVEYNGLNIPGIWGFFEISIRTEKFCTENLPHVDHSSILPPWEEVIKDMVPFTSGSMEPLQKYYDLLVPYNLFQTEPFNFNFWIVAGIQPSRSLQTPWVYDTGDFCAIINKPSIQQVEESVDNAKDALDQRLRVYRREMRAMRSKRKRSK